MILEASEKSIQYNLFFKIYFPIAMCLTKLRVEVEQWEDEGVFLVSRLSVESVPAGDVVQEERDEEDTCSDGKRDNLALIVRDHSPIISLPTNRSSIVQFGHQDDVCVGIEGGQEDVEN